VKLSPFFAAFGKVARRLDAAGADGLVLFNRFFERRTGAPLTEEAWRNER
jgi:dihydroorotate dehydrogenase